MIFNFCLFSLPFYKFDFFMTHATKNSYLYLLKVYMSKSLLI